MKGSLVWLPLRRTWRHRTNSLLLHFRVTSAMVPRSTPTIAHSLVLRQNWETLTRRSNPSDVDVSPYTVFIHTSVFWCKSANLLPLGFEAQTKKLSQWFWGLNHQTVDLSFDAQTKKPSQWFWGQTTYKPLLPVLRLNRKTCASRLLHMYDADRTRYHSTSWSSSHRVLDMWLIIPDPPHQVSYSCLDLHRCLSCRIHHLRIMRQANTFLHTE
jgi:hypothetical protein